MHLFAFLSQELWNDVFPAVAHPINVTFRKFLVALFLCLSSVASQNAWTDCASTAICCAKQVCKQIVIYTDFRDYLALQHKLVNNFIDLLYQKQLQNVYYLTFMKET